ncbi:hypothetical protein J4218_00900 [Candidatus Pacearchaeota archaeon]|nr:hypothetical protein [Candidatus Pacearchaeota archaeon]
MTIEQTFQIQCKGRSSSDRLDILEQPVDVRVRIYQREGSNMISSDVSCPYNTGAHGDRCSAGNERDSICPYAWDIPYALDTKGLDNKSP